MPLEEEMHREIARLEREIDLIDTEMEKLHSKILQFITLRKKKEHDLRILRGSFAEEDKEFQTTLARLLREKAPA
ncbi:MAG: hypothetical protein HYY37_05685 [Candidatus Aenigmarchaeota archaeon]|nr:hypothetical protein [Candidatus Aenigmarchaeota archaeon]